MNSFNAKSTLTSGDKEYTIYRLDALEKYECNVKRLPYCLKVLLENLLRTENDRSVTPGDVLALANWDPKAAPSKEIAFTPARVLLQDFTGVPCVVDLAAMRAAMKTLGGDPNKINPLQPVELVIDHSVQVDAYGSEAALLINRDLEYARNQERYEFLKWGQTALDNFQVVPPNTGIVHQVNLEHLARVTFVANAGKTTRAGRATDAENEWQTGEPSLVAYPDTLVGTDSHTTMVNGLGVLGWGVGGIEAEAAMLGQPVSMLIPQVVGFRLVGKLAEGATGTDLVLTVTEMLRKKGVVGKFVEFYGPGVATLPLADRATIGNMAPEYGATCGIFPVDQETLNYMRLTGRSEEQIALTEKYFREQGMFFTGEEEDCTYSDTLELDLSTVEPSIAGPKRPQDRLKLSEAKKNFHTSFDSVIAPKQSLISKVLGGQSASAPAHGSGGVAQGQTALLEAPTEAEKRANAAADEVGHGSVVVAAITSCTNTSNPSLMLAAGLVAKKAFEKGLQVKPWVKTSLAPGSRVATEMFKKAGLLKYLEEMQFDVVGYGCTTCIGNSGPLPAAISQKINAENLVVCSVLSGNRNFEGRINQDVKANYLMSPPLVVAYALAGTIDIDISKDVLGEDQQGQPVYLKDIWPTQAEIAEYLGSSVKRELYTDNYADVFKGDDKWNSIEVHGGDLFEWNAESTYIKNPPYFDGMTVESPAHVEELIGMRCLALLGDSVTTDHISPAGAIKMNSPAGTYLTSRGVPAQMFNSYGSRRGNDEIMVRGTFANIRLRNQLAPGTEGGFTTYLPTGDVTSIFDAAMQYKATETPLIVVAGKEYGTGSSRDWAAKGTLMLGIKAVLAQSFERIHRSNLIGMGVLPLEFLEGCSAESLKLTGKETFDLIGLREAVDTEFANGKLLYLRAAGEKDAQEFQVRVRIDTPQELLYYKNGGILQYVLRQLIGSA